MKISYWIIVFLCVSVFFQLAYRYHFYYMEHLQLFLFTREYAVETIMQPWGLLIYIRRFFVQFYCLAYAGALLTAATATAAGLLAHRLLNRFSRSRLNYAASLLPVGLVIFLHINYFSNIWLTNTKTRQDYRLRNCEWNRIIEAVPE